MQEFYLWLSELKGFSAEGRRRFRNLGIEAQELFSASKADLSDLGFSPKDCEALLNREMARVREIQNISKEKGISVLTPDCADFPDPLRRMDNPPLSLYCLGDLPDTERTLTLAIVGHRHASEHGIFLTEEIACELSNNGVIIVSGGAEGIDSAAMRGAIRAGGPLVGVLGNGVDIVYPAVNRELFRSTKELGCLLSEYAPGTAPSKWNFPERNRLISGLSHGVLIAEAPRKSGSMITAAHALEQGKDVFAMPGTAGVDRFSGSNDLIRQGAYLTESAEDILSFYRGSFDLVYPGEEEKETKKPPKADTPDGIEGLILSLMSEEPVSVDELIEKSKCSAAEVTCALTMLQIKGLIRMAPGGSCFRI